MHLPDLNIIWFLLVGILFTGYAILDGFDFGVGILHLFVKKDEDRRFLLNSIGPVWDGNEVWLVTGGGALFAAFPGAYATVFSGFYDAFMLLLAALIFRAVSIEFRSKEPTRLWRQSWDIAFSVASFLAAFLIGVAMGNITRGIPLDPQGDFVGTFIGLLNPYSLLLGVTVVALFAMHGAIFLVLKTEGELQATIKGWVPKLIAVFLALFIVFNIATLFECPDLVAVMLTRPYGFIVLALDILAALSIGFMTARGYEFGSFLMSSLTMVLLMAVLGLSYFPHMVISMPDPGNSLTIYNCASSQKTLGYMLIIAIIGVPIVLAYTVSIYWIFRGKTRLGHVGY
ncbi:MAG: cytochrome d ubiquinol oxidase subunit II [Verrucomicrobia bacterium]|nr:cytochrome d ubiquinol oxidase subunit II [Verrucomicrobiota bacterium]